MDSLSLYLYLIIYEYNFTIHMLNKLFKNIWKVIELYFQILNQRVQTPLNLSKAFLFLQIP